MDDSIFKNNLENKLVEVFGMMQNQISLLEILCKSGENAGIDSELYQLISSLIIVIDSMNLMKERQDVIIKEFHEYYCK